ncbi:alpha/beta fold hydrolase [Arthrobacter sp. zg-Y411]|uniref:alpha/beta fold hydrolase n=1 Tax=Arthrobacter zhangbolii TaxID=2886936 RepID=UPI001D13A65D|nr:alpha/beta fold hydrolase [Arthrobacter zhangbolii]MCC3294020.1 alpha/beta fold hydrolase [Arthrobacter zhangbolii]
MDSGVEHLDVLIIGAGLSGIGVACRLREDHPGRSVALLETRGRPGGTWDLFRYPGVRSDSDLYTFGYDFRPWREEKAIADGASILEYLKGTAAEYGVDALIRYHHKVLSADWSTRDARWTVTVERTRTPEAGPDGAAAEPVESGEILHLTANWIFNAAGYYRYDQGYAPDLPGREQFTGPVVHPQHWPEDLEVAGRRIAVIGSGATAVTLVPALAELGAQVTMVQRTPTYILPVPATDPVARRLRGVVGPERTGRIMAEVSARRQLAIWSFCRRWPKLARKVIRGIQSRAVPEGFEREHLNPPYQPWDQRLCAVPDGDFFAALRSGKATMVTGQTTGFTERGLRLASGAEVEADVVVTATGFTVQVFGGMDLRLDGTPVDLTDHVAYRGVMLSGIPNMAFAIGYTNASWTLKIGLVTRWFSRLLTAMDRQEYAAAVPVAPSGMPTRPLLDFGAGYVQRSLAELPRQGMAAPWLMTMNFLADRRDLQKGALVDKYLQFSGPQGQVPGEVPDGTDRFVTLESGLRLCYRVEGPEGGEPVVLLSGLGLDLTAWPAPFVAGLTSAGHRVIRLDNRDAGRSDRMDTPTPTVLHQALARPMPGAYRIEDMADDVIGLLDHLQVERAHVVGMSLGGMIAQSVAAHHPDRVLTLTSLISTTGARNVGAAAFSTKRRFAARPPRTREEFIRARVGMMRHLSGRANPADPSTEAELAGQAWDRGAYPDGGTARARQLGAINASADRTGDLARIKAPTLVIHGDKDPIVHPSGGAATAAAIPGARSLTIPGMGHYFHPAVVPDLLRHVSGHLGADASAASSG